MKKLEQIINCKDVSLKMKAKNSHTLVLPATMYVCESWTVKKGDKEKTYLLDILEIA